MGNFSIKINQSELKIGITVLLTISLLTILDLFEDWEEGVELAHILTEAAVILVSLFGAVRLWFKIRIKSQAEKLALESALNSTVNELSVWKAKAQTLHNEFQEAIDQQFAVWNMTQAERDVGVLLLKGLSFKEIADLRNTSEQTVRQQAASIYNRSGLEGRAQFSAYFLDELFS